jgi:hypothetical protein
MVVAVDADVLQDALVVELDDRSGALARGGGERRFELMDAGE